MVYDGKTYNDSEDYIASHNEKDEDWLKKWKNLYTNEEVKDTSTNGKTKTGGGKGRSSKGNEPKPVERPTIMRYTPTSFAPEIEGTGTQVVKLNNGSYPSAAQPKSGRDNAGNSIR